MIMCLLRVQTSKYQKSLRTFLIKLSFLAGNHVRVLHSARRPAVIAAADTHRGPPGPTFFHHSAMCPAPATTAGASAGVPPLPGH